ncbi:hypothetical protein [Leifsonia sp. 1010]|uniref:hypothetical protein n=1 Tax=Leifsonia sp. 1010 TaxID=2817769 RepID=UPI00286BC523|nr:hypothetical protein [Leifsonia sp. 1010]
MGLIYDSGDSAALKTALSANLTAASAVLTKLSSASTRLTTALGTGELSGKGYTAVDSLFAQIIAPCVKEAKDEIDSIAGELETYTSEDSKVSTFGVLKEDELNTQLTATKKQRDATEHQIEVHERAANSSTAVPGLSEALQAKNAQLELVLNQLEKDITELEDKLKALRDFASATKGLFMGRLENLAAATGDVIALLKSLSEPYVTSGVKLDLLGGTGDGLGAAATRKDILDYLKGGKIKPDSKGRLKVGGKFLYNPKGDFLYGGGKGFNEATKSKLDHYKKPMNAGAKGAADALLDDYKGWKDASKLARYGKGFGLAGTALTVGSNVDKYFSDGVQDRDVPDFAVDTGVDVATGLAAAGAGAAFGSLVLPPAGTIVGALVGFGIGVVVNLPIWNGASTTDVAKDAIKKTYR